ncbi:MAG: DUF2461 domain-containing protein [Clostridiales bacterium]|nr:DUF2461 domain-containing protein [Clostridiales bacterium]
MFQGFSDETIQFLWGIALNNERSWFNAHKEEYLTHLYQPMQELGRTVYDRILEQNPGLLVNLHVTRIYRDARRLHGGGPYKDHLWLSLERPHDRDENWHDIPSLWFEVSRQGYGYGLGYWGTPADMEAYRRRIRREPEVLEALVRDFERQDTFVLEGQSYKRPKGSISPPAGRLVQPEISQLYPGVPPGRAVLFAGAGGRRGGGVGAAAAPVPLF